MYPMLYISILHSVRSQHLSIRSNILRSFVVSLPPKPKQCHEYSRATGQQAGVVHRRGRDGHGKRKAENHDKDDDVQRSDRVYDEANRSFHPEPARCYLGASAQQVR